MGTTVAASARVANERQAEAQTIEQQLERLRASAAAQGWTLDEAPSSRDDGARGTHLSRLATDPG